MGFFADPALDTDIQELASLTAGEGDIENFERLFSKLKEMKGNLQLTSPNSENNLVFLPMCQGRADFQRATAR